MLGPIASEMAWPRRGLSRAEMWLQKEVLLFEVILCILRSYFPLPRFRLSLSLGLGAKVC